MDKKIIATAALIGAFGIILGAFGAHGLKNLVSAENVATFETGVKYQIYHALFLLFAGTSNLISPKAKKLIFMLVISGLFLFSGSIYLLSLNTLFTFDFRKIGFITPIGGLLLIISWIVLFLSIIKRNR